MGNTSRYDGTNGNGYQPIGTGDQGVPPGPEQGDFSTVIHVNVAGLIHPAETIKVALEGIAERAAQDLKWGESNHPDAPAGVKFHNAYFGICTEEAAKKNCEHAFRSGGGSNAHILIEEVAEAIAAIPNPVQLRAELVQVMGVCIKWIEQIDRRSTASDAVERATAPFYVLPRSSGSSFVKEGNFFRSRGGLHDEWGANWIPVAADSIEAARRLADAMVEKKSAPIYNSEAPGHV